MVLNAVVYFLIAAALAAVFLLCARKKETKRFGLALLTVTIILEVAVFNFHSFHLIGKGYEETELDLGAAEIKGNVRNDEGKIVSNSIGSEVKLTFEDINKKIGTLLIECNMDVGDGKMTYSAPFVDVEIDASDETNSADYRYSIAQGQIINGSGRSKYIVLALSGNVEDLRIRLSTQKDSVFEIVSVTANSSVPFEFSPIRLLCIVGAVMAIYALVRFPSLKRTCEENKKQWLAIAFTLTGACAAIAVLLTVLYNLDRGGSAFTSFALTSGNQITQELVDAFKAGHAHLLGAPSDELLAMENPYDWSARIDAGVSYKWDHLLYDGKYYSYYGIAPVLLLFLPYNLLTGYYFPTDTAVMIFGIVGIAFLTMLFLELIKRFFPRISVGMAVCSLAILQLSSGIWYCFCSPLFYEIAQASGFMFTCMGFYFLVRSGVVGKERISKLSLCLSSFCLSMAVLCRPTLALYCIVALIFIGFGFFKDRQQAYDEQRSVAKSSVVYLISALSCFAVIGGVQMIYNYMRFGSFFDFGIQYSLTINDFTRSQYHTDLAAIGFWNYLFAFPYVRPQFPFVFSNFSDLGVNGYYFIANTNAIGLLWRALPLFAYFGAAAAYRKLDKKTKRRALPIVLATCIAAPLIIIFSIWESGYGVRYSVDFAWQMIIGGIMILYVLYLYADGEAKDLTRSLISKFLVVSLAVAFVCNFALIYEYMNKDGIISSAYLELERLFEFWR